MMRASKLKLILAAALMGIGNASMALYDNEYQASQAPVEPVKKDKPVNVAPVINRSFTRSSFGSGNRASRRAKRTKHK